VEHREHTGPTIVDEGSFQPVVDELQSRDPLGFPEYKDALVRAGREAIDAGPARIEGRPIELAVFDFTVMGGSMGEVVGERLARAFERATERSVPIVLLITTGGARMQEGMVSLVQMPKIVAARVEASVAQIPSIAVLGNPTTGGVLASVGHLADVTVAIEGATIGFAGPRVVHRVTGEPLPPGAHSSAFALTHGLVDSVAARPDVRTVVAHALEVLAPDELEAVIEPDQEATDPTPDPWTALQAVRARERPRPPKLAAQIADASMDLRGDRSGTEDSAVVCRLARIAGRRALVVATDPDHSPGPGAYRKTRRALAIAVRLGLPVVTLIDTRGADPSLEAEQSGIAAEIAATFEAMLTAPVPIMSIVTGEGGSGGALAFATGDVLFAYSDSIFTVLDVEAAAEILWRDVARAPDAARLLKIGAHDLLELGIADGLIRGPPEARSFKRFIAYHLARLAAEGTGATRAATRRRRWRTVGTT
jgi:acyl-CoA carboxylase subunit beta